MKQNFWMKMAATAMTVFILAGCDKNDPVSSGDNTTMATEDAAESIASAVGSDNGGTMDQLSDIAELAGVAGIQGQEGEALGKASATADIDTSYDPGTGTWTMVISRERGSANGLYYAAFSRTYTYQFLHENGQPQKYWRVRNGGQIDTAAAIKFNIVSGTGRHRTPRLSQQLTGLSGAFTATGTNTPVITINGNYARAAVDTITTRNSVRTLDHALTLNVIDVKIPRGNRGNFAHQITGTITGNYTATATFTRGSLYSEKNINRDFTITLGGGNARIKMRGLDYIADLLHGELRP